MGAKKIFISYPSKSKSEMLELTEQLKRDEFDSIWRDDDHIPPGAIISHELQRGCRDSDCCILVLTKHTEKSAWCMQEVGAFWGAAKPIIVYHVDRSVPVPELFADVRVARDVHEVVRALRSLPSKKSLVKKVFPNAADGHFRNYLKSLALRANRVRLIGTGLEILGEPNFTKEILARVANGDCKSLEVYLGDPYSPAVEARLIEENLGDPFPVPVGKDGIIHRALGLTAQWKRHFPTAPPFEVKLFTHCPTFALLIFDDDYFFYPYGCERLGNFSPVFQLSGDVQEVPAWREVIGFFEDHCARVKRSSTSLPRLTNHGKVRTNLDVGKLLAFRLCYVPHANSPLYRFGSHILGYDMRKGTELDSRWQEFVGEAKPFGFHLTVCDTLYFLNKGEFESAINEAQFIASEFEEFEIADLQVTAGLPDDHSISLVPKDHTGSLEAIHHECVHRLYRRAVASNYTLGLATLTGDNALERTTLMIEKYLAPSILNRYCPHFTLLSNVPIDKKRRIHAEVSRSFVEKVADISLRVDNIAVMSKGEPNSPWVIESEFPLKAGRAARTQSALL